ncbi:MAG: hypothetical protein LJE64_12115 [Desulfofustis sp.]|jgi:hypothetical protein|nr:hypothetical protein [Desulfofustis sp.]
MPADKPYLRNLVKDDLSRFFIGIGLVAPLARDTSKDWVIGGSRAESLGEEGFGGIGLF